MIMAKKCGCKGKSKGKKSKEQLNFRLLWQKVEENLIL